MKLFKFLFLFSILLISGIGHGNPNEDLANGDAYSIDQAEGLYFEANETTSFSDSIIDFGNALYEPIFVLKSEGNQPLVHQYSYQELKFSKVNSKSRAPPYTWQKIYSRTFQA